MNYDIWLAGITFRTCTGPFVEATVATLVASVPTTRAEAPRSPSASRKVLIALAGVAIIPDSHDSPRRCRL